MSRLNTLYPNDEFLKGISNVMGKIDSKNKTEIKQEIEQIGYKEFYRYSKEKDVYIKQLKQRIDKATIISFQLRTHLSNWLFKEGYMGGERTKKFLDELDEILKGESNE